MYKTLTFFIFGFTLFSFLCSAQDLLPEESEYLKNIEKRIRIGNFDSLYQYTSRFRNLQEKNFTGSENIRIYNDLFLALSQANTGKVEDALNTLLTLEKKVENKKFKALAEGVGGIIKYRQGNFKECLALLNRSVEHLSYQKNKNTIDHYFYALFLRFEGRTYSETGVYLQAISILQKSNQIFNRINFVENIYVNYKFIGRIYLLSSRNNKMLREFALENFLLAAEGFKTYKAEDELSWIYTVITDYYLGENNTRKAKLYQDSAFNLIKKEDVLLRGLAFNNYGRILEINNDRVNAKTFFLKAVKEYKIINNYTNRATTYYNLSKVLLEETDIKKALFYADSSLLYSIKAQNSDKISKTYRLISNIYKEKSDYKNAYDYFLKSYKLSEELSEKQNKAIAFSYRTIYKTEQQDKENLMLKNASDIKDLKMYNYKIYALIFIVFVLFLSIAVSLRMKRSRQINAAMFKLKGQEEEKQRLSRELHDGIGSSLKGIAIKITHLAEKNNLENNVSKIVENVLDINNELRRISHDLALPFQQNIDENIKQLVEKAIKHNSISIFYNAFPRNGWDLVDYKVSVELYRIVQEAINNILEHSGSESAEIQLTRSKDRVLLTISDEGKGFNTDDKPTSGIGMSNIKSRVKILKGDILITSEPDGGTTVEISIPA